MQVLTRDWFNITHASTFTIVPLGDIHIGARACDEARFRQVVQRIADDPNCLWVGMGDYADFINRTDPRFSPTTLAPWIKMADLADLPRAQKCHFLEIVRPIASKCIGLLEGNHELSITRHYERDIFAEIVTGIKEMGGFPADHQLALGYYGWLMLRFYRAEPNRRERARVIKMNLHHGFVGGRLAGAKSLNLQRWLWTHDADVVLMGHSHNTGTQTESVEYVDRSGTVRYAVRHGAYTGTFLRTTNDGAPTYAEVKGYLPMPTSHVELRLRPGTDCDHDVVQVLTMS